MKDNLLTERVIGCFYMAYNELGFGYPESVYSSALDILFREAGIRARREHGVDVYFWGQRVGAYRLDLLVEDQLVLELKAGYTLHDGAKGQLISYLRSSRRGLGLLLFFGPSPRYDACPCKV